MAVLTPTTPFGTQLANLMLADDLQPGVDAAYQTCKLLYLYHPLGRKMAESPVALAQSQEREIAVPSGPEEALKDAFKREWENLGASNAILNLKTQARVYGIASVGMLVDGRDDPARPIVPEKLYELDLAFNVWDPLNTSGSLTFSQDPNSPTFQKHRDLVVNGQPYHRTRTITAMNENPIYIAWTSSAFGFVGRSVYQRALYPMKTYLNTLVADDMVARKVGLLVAKMETPGSFVDRITQAIFGQRRALLKEAQTDNVLTIGLKEAVDSLNLQNLDGPLNLARNDAIKNCATGADLPAKMLTQEAYVEGFGEGTEDAKAVAAWIDRLRLEMNPEYRFFDRICQHRAWNPRFYETIQRRFPEYARIKYETAFYQWQNDFVATWPSLIQEEPSKEVEVDKVRFEAVTALVQILLPILDPVNKTVLVQWACDCVNSRDKLFDGAKLTLDYDALRDALEEAQAQQDEAAKSAMGGGNLASEENAARPPRPFHDATGETTKLLELISADRGQGRHFALVR